MGSNLAQDVWLLVCTGLVLFMQPGFLCLEAGAVRRRNAVNVAMKNFTVELVSTIAFMVVGYSLMFRESLFGWIGTPSFMLVGIEDRELFQFLFQAVFCGTAATIVSGAVAERLRFLPFVLESAFLCALLYPLFGHWVWGGGWLSQMGFKDFAGSSVVHLMGAGVALAGILQLGPRIGRFDTSGKAVEIPPSDLVISSLGTFILLFGWIGFNGGSAPFGDHTALIVANTLLAGCFGGVAAMLSSWALRGISDITLILNGTLGGLVAITACADIVPFSAAPVIGILAGIVVHACTVLLNRLRLDDAVGALPVHGACGILGLLLAPLFATSEALLERATALGVSSSRLDWLGVQSLGTAACLVVSIGGGWLIWKAVSLVTALRVSAEGEMVGMNYSEHRLADPVQEIMSTLRRPARTGIDLTALRGSEFEPLARALNELLQDVQGREDSLVRTRGEISNAGLRLDQARRQAQARHEVVSGSLADLLAKLEHLVAFSRSQTTDQGAKAAIQVVGDLADQLSRSLRDTTLHQGQIESQWARIEEISMKISQLGVQIATVQAAKESRNG